MVVYDAQIGAGAILSRGTYIFLQSCYNAALHKKMSV